MKYLLDTNVLSELTKVRPLPQAVEWIHQNQSESAISAITIGELVRGIEFLPEGKKKNRLRRELMFFQHDYRDRILAFDDWVAVTWGGYCASVRRAGLSLSVLDSQIAATAVHYELTVATGNVSHFPLVETVNPLQA